MMRRFPNILFTSALALGLCLGTPAHVKADWLDRIDRQFEETFTKTDAAFDKAMNEGVAELDKELADIWGDARSLPDEKVWVGYSKDKKSRIIVDYERGEMSVEGFDQSEEELMSDFQDILLEDSKQLDERAILREKLIRKVDEFWKDQKTRKRSVQKNTKIKWNHPRELSTLIEPRVRPVFVKRSAVFQKGASRNINRLTIPLREDRDQLSAQALRDPVSMAARKYNLPRSLLLSVIKNESAFNPRARSHANALGLMQLVPTSGGKEAYSYLMGYDATPGPDILYDPEQNIMLGAAYLHLLNTRYFGKVKDAKTRQYLIIAAYNTGAGNVAKAFTGKMKLQAAIQKINQMKANDVFAHLKKHLPYAETKTYLARVSGDIPNYASWDA
ncbi:transglycosylase SLT domain-containing protein [Terasakiella sp. A23]|uniref:transglycosylase SLT domain-containing protein n=1 Tax=Terasakiella sp. FCG-A23 TaxID=3080561 RepID=UPI002952B05F|nr:transglycosylase SLT domain-containing protein [Terasakiella sp. A23]MDV7339131.1 transglycosylase SLT domain-containing protein [Terasakiella sp. A23]